MRALRSLCMTLAMSMWLQPAAAHHVDPYEVIDRAFSAYKEREDYSEVRAVFSAALRDAPHSGKLDPEFALLYALYSDSTRYDGNPSFALLLAEEGLALANSVAEPDIEVRNTLIISRAYALADLGRYEEAAKDATLASVWLEKRFGEQARADLESEVKKWTTMIDGADLPSVAELAIELLEKADDALVAGDTGTAISLASRALLPDASGLSNGAVRLVNAWVKSVVGAAYGVEGRHYPAAVTLLDAVNLLSAEPWNGRDIITVHQDIGTELSERIVWDVFIRLAASAVFIDELEIAEAALLNVEPYATTPEARYSLLVQRASVLMQSKDYAAVEKVFHDSEEAAIAAGNEENALLARFYALTMKVRQQDEPDAASVEAMLQAAMQAAEAARNSIAQVEYILTTATRLAVNLALAYDQTLTVSRAAYAAFLERQASMATYEAGQEAARRDRRRFLETHVGLLYEISKKPAPIDAQ